LNVGIIILESFKNYYINYIKLLLASNVINDEFVIEKLPLPPKTYNLELSFEIIGKNPGI
jgi:hypothetical protein